MQQIDGLLRQGYTEGSPTPKINTTQIGVTFNLETFTLKQALVYFINHIERRYRLGWQQDALGGVPEGLRPHQREHVRFLQDLLPAGGRVAFGIQVGGLAALAVQPEGGSAFLPVPEREAGCWQ